MAAKDEDAGLSPSIVAKHYITVHEPTLLALLMRLATDHARESDGAAYDLAVELIRELEKS